MGLDVSYIYRADFTPTGSALADMYNALADGKYIVFTIPSAYSPTQSGLVDIAQLYLGHAIAITGVTPKGEFIVQDSGAQGFWQVGLRNNSVGRIPAQNLINYAAYQSGVTGAILSKKEAT